MMVEHRSWKSALALVSWSALFRSDWVILYFLAAAFSIVSAMPSLRNASMREASDTHIGSSLASADVPSAPVVKRSPASPAHPASTPATPATASAFAAARIMEDMATPPNSVVAVERTRSVLHLLFYFRFLVPIASTRKLRASIAPQLLQQRRAESVDEATTVADEPRLERPGLDRTAPVSRQHVSRQHVSRQHAHGLLDQHLEGIEQLGAHRPIH